MTRSFSLIIALVLSSLAFASEVKDIDWLELMPADELERLMNQAPVDHTGMMQSDQLASFRTVPEMNDQEVRIPGYIVPVTTDAQGRMSEFFLVPYFGACIHVPPPPPNQILFATLAEPIPMTEIYDAYWIEGHLTIEQRQSEIAATAYSIAVRKVELYQ